MCKILHSNTTPSLPNLSKYDNAPNNNRSKKPTQNIIHLQLDILSEKKEQKILGFHQQYLTEFFTLNAEN